MPIIVPDPPSNQITVQRELELAYHRRTTDYFIAWNPIEIVLIPKVRVKSPSGSKEIDGTPKGLQRFRLIPQSETTPPVIIEDGVERVIDFVLLGSWNADMTIGDHWRDTLGFYHEILDVTTNGYEVKGMVQKHGGR